MNLSIHLSIYLSFFLSTYLSNFLVVFLPIYLSIYLSIHLSAYLINQSTNQWINQWIYLSIDRSIHRSIYLSLSLYLSLCLPTCLSAYLPNFPVSLSVYPNLCISLFSPPVRWGLPNFASFSSSAASSAGPQLQALDRSVPRRPGSECSPPTPPLQALDRSVPCWTRTVRDQSQARFHIFVHVAFWKWLCWTNRCVRQVAPRALHRGNCQLRVEIFISRPLSALCDLHPGEKA